MESKIKKYEDEIGRIQASQKEMIRKNDAKIRELKMKIKEEQQRIDQNNSVMIVDAVRSLYGEVNENNLEQFKTLLASMSKPVRPHDTGEGE